MGLRNHIEYFDMGFLDYRLNSRLVEVRANCAVSGMQKCDSDYFVLVGTAFRHLGRKERRR